MYCIGRRSQYCQVSLSPYTVLVSSLYFLGRQTIYQPNAHDLHRIRSRYLSTMYNLTLTIGLSVVHRQIPRNYNIHISSTRTRGGIASSLSSAIISTF